MVPRGGAGRLEFFSEARIFSSILYYFDFCCRQFHHTEHRRHSSPNSWDRVSGSGGRLSTCPARPIAIHRDPLQAQLVGQKNGLGDIPRGGLGGQVDGLADGAFHVGLEGRLHPDLSLHAHLEGGGKQAADILGETGERPHPAGGQHFGEASGIHSGPLPEVFPEKGG